jgi:capsular polysaccharide biosynthesis protein
MSEQALDLRRSMRTLWRRKILIGLLIALGLLAGAGYAVLRPPMLIGTALVVLPSAVPAQATAAALASPGPDDAYMATQVVIATSDPVLSRALPHVSPAMSLKELRTKVQAKGLTDSILSISATGPTAAQAEATVNAVAYSYTSFVGSKRFPGGRVQASVFQPSANATGMTRTLHLIVFALIGGAAGALIGIILALAINRPDRRLTERDEIAAAVGIPVLTSIPVAHPTNAAGWTRLLDSYEPGAVHGLRLRRTLDELGMAGFGAGNGSRGASSSLAVLSLSSDPGALALGPQLAVFAASLGIPTTLVVGPDRETTAAAALQTACSVPAPASSKRPDQLRVTVFGSSDFYRQPGAMLTVVVIVVDGRNPRLADAMRTTATVLGVSAGAATGDELARAVTSAAADGREMAGILVADPEPTDRSLGRIPPREMRARTPQIARTLDEYGNGNRRPYDPESTVVFSPRIGDNPPDPSTEIRR